MSAIIPPRDVITITMYNLETPPRLNVDISREMPFPVVAAIIGQALTALGQASWKRMSQPLVAREPDQPPAAPPTKPNGTK